MLLGVLVIYYHLWSHTLKLIALLNITIFLAFFLIPLLVISKYSKTNYHILLIHPIITTLWWSYCSSKEGIQRTILVSANLAYIQNISTHCHTKIILFHVATNRVSDSNISFNACLYLETILFSSRITLILKTFFWRSGITETSLTLDTKSELVLFRSTNY